MSAAQLPEEMDGKAIEDLTRMAFLYTRRGNVQKAAELMSLVEQIEKRAGHVTSVNLEGWRFEQKSRGL